MPATPTITRMDHLGIVAGIAQEIGLVEYLNELDMQDHERVSTGQAVLAMLLNGLGFSNRQLYLVSQFYAKKPIEVLLGKGITAEDLNDDRLGRALDWLTAHDLTALFAGIAMKARKIFGFPMKTIHVDTTSLSISGEYLSEQEPDSHIIHITHGYSRDHREDLKQWMMSLATADVHGIPIGLQLLSGNTSDKESLIQQIKEVLHQLDGAEKTEGMYIADSGAYSEENMNMLNRIGWIARVPETSTNAKEAVQKEPDKLCGEENRQWWEQTVMIGDRKERWLVVRTAEGMARCLTSSKRKAEKDQVRYEKRLAKLSTYSCEADAQKALDELGQSLPKWITVEGHLRSIARYSERGRPVKGAVPTQVQWTIEGTVQIVEAEVEREAKRLAWFIVATNLMGLPAEEILRLYQEQSSVERGWGFIKDPLFLASSVFVKKPERVMALGFIMVCCLLLYRLAEYRVRSVLAQRQETVPNQKGQPTARPTMRWIFQCFEGIHLLTLDSSPLIVGVTDFHRHILSLLGPLYEQLYALNL